MILMEDTNRCLVEYRCHTDKKKSFRHSKDTKKMRRDLFSLRVSVWNDRVAEGQDSEECLREPHLFLICALMTQVNFTACMFVRDTGTGKDRCTDTEYHADVQVHVQ